MMTVATDARMRRPGVVPILVETARDLFPGCFALLMATGVVSIASQPLGLRVIAVPLVGIAWVAYLMLSGLTPPEGSSFHADPHAAADPPG
jgi:hypothetical protein